MPTIRQHQAVLLEPSGPGIKIPLTPAKESMPLRLVKRGMSAIEFIVETAQPGEVDHIGDGDYYNTYLWRCYEGLDASS